MCYASKLSSFFFVILTVLTYLKKLKVNNLSTLILTFKLATVNRFKNNFVKNYNIVPLRHKSVLDIKKKL